MPYDKVKGKESFNFFELLYTSLVSAQLADTILVQNRLFTEESDPKIENRIKGYRQVTTKI